MIQSRTSRPSAMRALAGVSALAIATAAALAATPAFATPQAQAAGVNFAIPAGDLDSALRYFSEQSRVQLVYPASITTGRRTQGVRSVRTNEQALAALLAGTGLTYRFNDANTVTLSAPLAGAGAEAGDIQLGAVRVEGGYEYAGAPTRGRGVAQLGGVRGLQDEEAIGYRPVVATAGGGAPTAIEDTPRSISVLTQDQMRDQDITDIGEALRRVPGITLIESGTLINQTGAGFVQSRGFALDQIQIDGGAPRPLNIIDNGLLNLSAYERVEVVHGPNGVFVGSGSPGGSINLVRKRPGEEATSEVAVDLGSFDRRQISVDYSTPSVGGSDIAFRAVGTYQNTGFQYDGVEQEDWSLYGILDIPLGERARVELGANYSELHANGVYPGIPRYLDGPLIDVPWTFNYMPDWAYQDVVSSEVFGRYYANLTDAFDFEFGFSFLDQASQKIEPEESQFLFLSNGTNAFGIPTLISFYQTKSSSEQLALDAKVIGNFRTGGLSHAVFAGMTYNSSLGPDLRETLMMQPGFTELTAISQLNPDFFVQQPFFPPFRADYGSSSTFAVVLQDVVSWREFAHLSLSLRRQFRERSMLQLAPTGDGGTSYVDLDETRNGDGLSDDGWLPSYGLTLKPWRNLSVFASWSEGLVPQDLFFTAEGQSLDPAKWESLEYGLKYGAQDWLFSLTAFNTEDSGLAVIDPRFLFTCYPSGVNLCYLAGEEGSRKATGVEVEFNGRLFNQLDVAASYVYTDQESLNPFLGVSTQTPSNEAKINLSWNPPSTPDWRLQASASYRGRVYAQGSTPVYIDPTDPTEFPQLVPFEYEVPAHVTYDLGVDYRLSDNLSLAAFVENVGDEEYFSTVAQRNFIARPRTFTLTLRWRDIGERRQGNGIGGLAPFGEPEDWYGAADVGVHDFGALNARSFAEGPGGDRVAFDFEADPDVMSTARVGYRLSPTWRVEAEGGFRKSTFSAITGSGPVPTGVCGAYLSPAACADPQGETEMWTAMANVVHDFGRAESRLRPFVGVGLGLGRYSIDFSGVMSGLPTNSNGSTDGATIGGDDGDVAWAYQALAGLSFKVTDRATFEATYRYFNAPDIGWKSDNLPTYLPNLRGFQGDYEDQSLTVGFRWAFQ